MPITFKSKFSPDILMLEAVARELITLMGHSGSVPGSLTAQDIPTALAQLQAALNTGATRTLNAEQGRDDEQSHAPAISLTQRAGPLLAMLQTALREQQHVLWER